MRKALIPFLIGLALSGCYCRRCYGQGTLWQNDQVVTATEAAEFRKVCEDMLNFDPAGLIEILFVVATNEKIPSGTGTVVTNLAQEKRWFKPEDTGSFVSRCYWRLGKVALERRMPPRPEVDQEVRFLATDQIPDATKRLRFLSRLDYLKSSSEEF